MKTMNKKLFLLIVFFISLFLIYIFFMVGVKNYNISYKVGNYSVEESYNKKNSIYTFIIDDDIIYEIKADYINHTKLIDNISLLNDTLLIESDYLTFNDINKNRIDIKETDVSIRDKYENIDIYDTLDRKYAIWNYNHFIIIDDNNYENITLFDRDVYSLDLIYKDGNKLYIPDYNQKYYFNKFYIFDINTLKTSSFNANVDIYFDSYFLGKHKDLIYLYDTNQKKEYTIDIKEKKVRRTSYQIIYNGLFESISQNKLDKKSYLFTYNEDVYFMIENNTLYYYTPQSRFEIYNNVDSIIEKNESEVFFVSDEVLYYYNYNNATLKKVMKYSEWKFNNKGIFVF